MAQKNCFVYSDSTFEPYFFSFIVSFVFFDAIILFSFNDYTKNIFEIMLCVSVCFIGCSLYMYLQSLIVAASIQFRGKEKYQIVESLLLAIFEDTVISRQYLHTAPWYLY